MIWVEAFAAGFLGGVTALGVTVVTLARNGDRIMAAVTRKMMVKRA